MAGCGTFSFVSHWSMHFVPVAEPPDNFGPESISMGSPVEPDRFAMPHDWPVHFSCAVASVGTRSMSVATTAGLLRKDIIAGVHSLK